VADRTFLFRNGGMLDSDRPDARAEPVDPAGFSEPPMTREIPRSEFARIRAWMKYGMTVAQVAGVYGVAVGAIERILRQG
jgi:hypothetical protein